LNLARVAKQPLRRESKAFLRYTYFLFTTMEGFNMQNTFLADYKRLIEENLTLRNKLNINSTMDVKTLIEACNTGNLTIVKDIVKKSSSIIHCISEVIFHNLFNNGYLEIIKYLVNEAGADINKIKDEALIGAAFTNKLDIIKFLVEECKADVNANGSEGLLYAVENGHLDVVKYLIDHGCNIHAWNHLLSSAVCSKNLELVKYIINKGFNTYEYRNAALHIAIQRGYQDIINYFQSLKN